ncbi:19864_t:CDS:2, partial [Racocetra persica]
FQYTCNIIKSDVESNPSAMIKTCYQKVFKTKTEYSSLAIMGFNITITSIGDLNENKFYGVSTGFVSSFTTHYCGAQYLFVLKIEEEQCNLEIYLESEHTHQFIKQTPDNIWNKWHQQTSTVIQFLLILQKIYLPEYTFQEKELRTWQSIFVACGYTNVTSVPKKESLIEFWSKASDSIADKESLETFYKNNIIQFLQNLQLTQDSTFWDSFRDALLSNKRGSDDALLLQKPKRTASRLTNIQEKQFLLFFQDGDNVKKFHKTYPNDMKRTSFIARLADSENLKYYQDLGRLCMICYDYRYDTFNNLENIIHSNFTDKNFMSKDAGEIKLRNRKSTNRIDAQAMYKELLEYIEAGNIEEKDVSKIITIQNWINTYAYVFKRRAEIESDNIKIAVIQENLLQQDIKWVEIASIQEDLLQQEIKQ